MMSAYLRLPPAGEKGGAPSPGRQWTLARTVSSQTPGEETPTPVISYLGRAPSVDPAPSRLHRPRTAPGLRALSELAKEANLLSIFGTVRPYPLSFALLFLALVSRANRASGR